MDRGQTGDIGIGLLAAALAAALAASLTGCGGGLKNPFSKEETKLPGERISAMPDATTASICKDRIIWGRSNPPQAQSGPAPQCSGRIQ